MKEVGAYLFTSFVYLPDAVPNQLASEGGIKKRKKKETTGTTASRTPADSNCVCMCVRTCVRVFKVRGDVVSVSLCLNNGRYSFT